MGSRSISAHALVCAAERGVSILRQILAPVAGSVAVAPVVWLRIAAAGARLHIGEIGTVIVRASDVAPVRGGKDFVKAAPFRNGFLTLMPRLAAEDAPLFQKGGQ